MRTLVASDEPERPRPTVTTTTSTSASIMWVWPEQVTAATVVRAALTEAVRCAFRLVR